jgi:hypothetical protein
MATANVPSSLILLTLIIEAIGSSETTALTRATRRHIPEDGNLQDQFYLLKIFCEIIYTYI